MQTIYLVIEYGGDIMCAFSDKERAKEHARALTEESREHFTYEVKPLEWMG